MSNSRNPYLSVIVTSRNDNHGGDMLKRMRMFVRALIHQCNAYKLPCELIMVEWNPIKGEKLLKEVLPSATEQDYLSIRYILVPNELHHTLAFSQQLPLFQMIAKNVGIRRATADFVLCTNVDIIFSNELFARLAKRDLKENCFYRANRCDIPATIDENWTVQEQLEFSRKNILKRNGKNHLYPNFSGEHGFLQKYFVFIPLLRVLSRVKALYATSAVDRLNTLDKDACGDFTLMSKQNWMDIEGYPELEVYSLHIDSMGVIAAEALGMKQVIFKPWECTYHIEHSNGWEFKTHLERVMFYTNKPVVDWWAIREAGVDLIQHKKKFGINKPTWGFADKDLQEIS